MFDARFDSVTLAIVDEEGRIIKALDVLPTPEFDKTPDRRISVKGHVAVAQGPDKIVSFGNIEDRIKRGYNHGGIRFSNGKATFSVIAGNGAYAIESLDKIADIIAEYNSALQPSEPDEETLERINELIYQLVSANGRLQVIYSSERCGNRVETTAIKLYSQVETLVNSATWGTRKTALEAIRGVVEQHRCNMSTAAREAEQKASLDNTVVKQLKDEVDSTIKSLGALIGSRSVQPSTAEPIVDETAPIVDLGTFGDVVKFLSNHLRSRDNALTPGWNAEIRHLVAKLQELVNQPAASDEADTGPRQLDSGLCMPPVLAGPVIKSSDGARDPRIRPDGTAAITKDDYERLFGPMIWGEEDTGDETDVEPQTEVWDDEAKHLHEGDDC